MKKIKQGLFVIITLLFCILWHTNSEPTDFERAVFTNNIGLRKIESDKIFNETLKYKIYWEFVYAGDAEMGIVPVELYGGKVYKIYTYTKSNNTIDVLYKVRNRTESYVDITGFYTLKFFKDQDEAGYRSKEEVLFDQKNNLWYNILDNTTGYIPTFVQDVVSALYWLRTQKLEVGQTYTFQVWVGKVVYPMIVDILDKCKIKVSGKEYICYKVEPTVDLKSFPLFRAKGRLFVYITADDRKLPVRLESKVFIGKVFANLVETN